MVIQMMLEHVEMNGLYTEGIYRKSGSACHARELHQLLETSKTATLTLNVLFGLVQSTKPFVVLNCTNCWSIKKALHSCIIVVYW